jgi:hypothetical protein
MDRNAASLVLAGFVVAAVGCGGAGRSTFTLEEESMATDPAGGGEGVDGTFGGNGSGTGVFLHPRNTTVIIDSATTPPTPGSVTYKVVHKTAQGEQDITSGATFTLEDKSLGSLSSATFTSLAELPAGTLGKSTRVTAETDAGSAVGTITVVQLRKTGPQRDFFFVVPYEEDPSPKNDTLTFSTSIKQVDVVFAMDTTGSMGGSINNLKSALSGTLFTQLQAAIPNVALGVVDYKDYPVSPYGSPGDFPVKVRQTVTTNLTAAQAAVGQYAASGGNDGPESQIPAMQHVLTGEALTWPGGSVPAHVPAAPGHWGGVDFRPGSVPVVVNITDVNWHGEGNTPYNFQAAHNTPTMASLKSAFLAKNAFFVNVTSATEAQANELSDATNSNVPPAAFGGACNTGVNGAARAATGPGGRCRPHLPPSHGNGVSTGIVKAIEAISQGAAYDVKADPANDPKNKNGVDATAFIKALRAMEEGDPASGCPAHAAKDSDGDGIKDTFVAVKVGTPVCFEVIPAKNETVPPEGDPQFYNAFVNVVGLPGNIQLDRRAVLFLVPPKDPGVK